MTDDVFKNLTTKFYYDKKKRKEMKYSDFEICLVILNLFLSTWSHFWSRKDLSDTFFYRFTGILEQYVTDSLET